MNIVFDEHRSTMLTCFRDIKPQICPVATGGFKA